MTTHPAAFPETSGPPNANLGSTLVLVWPLLFGVALLMLGNGLQGSLLGLRAELEGFSTSTTGLIMASFFGGFLAGSHWTPKALVSVGHIRVFAALSAVASVSILAHVLVIESAVWAAVRFLTGFCYAGIFVVAESWLNNRVPRAARGQLLAVYMAISFAGMGGGQFLLNLADPMGTQLFIIVSILISLSVVPMLLQASPGPALDVQSPVSIKRLYRASPLGVLGVLVAGISNGTVFGMGAVYTSTQGYTVSETAAFMGAAIAGAAILQYPIGRLSDLIDRRKVILLVSILSVALALLAGYATRPDAWQTYLAVAAMGGSALSIHSLAIAYTNDYLDSDEVVAASGGLVLVLGIGSVTGPLMVGFLLGNVGPNGFFVWIAAVNAGLALFAIWRMTQREELPAEEQAPYVGILLQPSELAATVAEQVSIENEEELAEQTGPEDSTTVSKS